MCYVVFLSNFTTVDVRFFVDPMVFDLLLSILRGDVQGFLRPGQVWSGDLDTLLVKDTQIRWVKHRETMMAGSVYYVIDVCVMYLNE